MTDGAWWDAFADAGGLPDLETWLGGVDAASRLRVRQRVAECHYESVLDCGAGLGLDWIGFSNLSHNANWQGIEPSAAMREAARRTAMSYTGKEPPITEGSITNIPFDDSTFDLVYCRHVWEHLPSFEKALSEMVRVALLEVVVVFFMRPGEQAYLFRERDGLWQNRYAKEDIERELAKNPKVEVFFWEHLHATEVILHAYLNNTLVVDPAKVAQRVAT